MNFPSDILRQKTNVLKLSLNVVHGQCHFNTQYPDMIVILNFLQVIDNSLFDKMKHLHFKVAFSIARIFLVPFEKLLI